MLFTTLKTKNQEYKLRLNVKSLINLEKRLGKNPMSIFMGIKKDELPLMEDMLVIFHESLQNQQHGITIDDVYNIYDEYIEEGNTYVDFISVILDIFKTSGIIKEESKGRKAKN